PPAPAGPGGSFRRLGRNTLIYSAGVLVQRVISVLMLPVYTRVMTPADYGVLDLLQMVTDVAALIFTAGLTAGLQRYYFQARDESERRAIVSTAFMMQVGFAVLGTTALLLLADPIAERALGGAGSPRLVRIAALNFSLGMFAGVPLVLMQTQERARLYLAVTVTKLVLQLGFNLLFLVKLRLGAQGVLLSTLITSVILGAWTAPWLIRQVGLHFSWRWLRELRRFGIPYQLAWAASFLLTFGDRFFLQAARGAASVGLYSMAYQFGFILAQAAGTPFIQAWRPQRFQQVDAPQWRRDATTRQGFFYLSLVLVTGATAMSLFVEPFLRVMTTREFYGAALMVPLIALAYVIETWANATSFGIEVSEKTRYNAMATWVSAVVALGLYSVLVPRFGGYGAAVGTVGGFTVKLLLTYRWSQMLWPVRYGWGRPLLTLAFGAAATVTFIVVRPASLLGQVGTGCALFAVYLVAVWTACLQNEERSLV
ncbi:MAG TPA: lipopolysaccharide biosynthesis protein, partial [Gemmatimonadales bacterium]|nr:lipopolysaccharide biosynthesis protein [Gemmatimonadales bacterium]